MHVFPALNIILQPNNTEVGEQLGSESGDKNTLIIYDTDISFLERVLAAAGYTAPADELHLLRREPDSQALDLTTLLRELNVDRVLLFGQELHKLGLHFTIAKYAPLKIGGYTFMVCDPVADIAAAKELGNNTPSRALWNGIKLAYLKR